MIDWLKKADETIGGLFEKTGLPELTGSALGVVGRGFDILAGTNVGPTVEQIGREVPRMVVEGALTLPIAATGAGVPAAAATWLNRGKRIGQILGYGSAAARGTAATDSLMGGAIDAGSLGLGNLLLTPAKFGGVGVGEKASGAVSRWLERNTPDVDLSTARKLSVPAPRMVGTTLEQRILPVAAHIGTDVGTITGINEATRQAQLSVGPNALPWDAPERDPLTPENIAGNVVSGALFAPVAVSAFRNRPRVQKRTQLSDWLAQRLDEEKTMEGSTTRPVTPEHKNLITLDALLDQYHEMHTRGEDDMAMRPWREAIYNRLTGSASAGTEDVNRFIKKFEQKTRMMPPDSPDKVQKFVADLNALADSFFENKEKALEVLGRAEPPELGADAPKDLPRRQVLVRKQQAQFEAEKTGWEGAKGKSWHPSALPGAEVSRLQAKGRLPKFTEEWFRTELGEEMGKTFDTTFNWDVVVQKALNKVYNLVPEALEAERTEAQATPAPMSRGTDATLEAMRPFIDALADLREQAPAQVMDMIERRTVDMMSKPSEMVRGRPFGSLSRWRQAIIGAAKTYNPETGTFKLMTKTKVDPMTGTRTPIFEEKPIAYLETWVPGRGFEKKGVVSDVGAKEAQATVPMEKVLESGDAVDLTDEQALAAYEAELASLAGTEEEGFRETAGQKGFGMLGGAEPMAGEFRPLEQVIPEVMKAEATKSGGELSRIAKQVRETVEGLNDPQLDLVLRDLYPKKNLAKAQGGWRLALRALMENFEQVEKPKTKADVGVGIGEAGEAFLDYVYRTKKREDKDAASALRRELILYFVPKIKDGSTRGMDAFKTNVGKVINKLADPKVAGLVKKGVAGTREMVGEPGEGPLVVFPAARRLRRWAAQPSGGITPAGDGTIPVGKVEPLLSRLGISGDEMAIYKATGLDEFLKERTRVMPEEVARWVEERAPRVEVERLRPRDEGTDNRVFELQHELETRRGLEIRGGQVFDVLGNEVTPRHLEHDKLVEEFQILRQKQLNALETDAATGRYGVEPKELKDMPGAVDILVRVPVTTLDPNPHYQPEGTTPVLFRGPHFGQSDVNVLASIRGYIETLPSGEKVFHIFEVQSDWGQKLAKQTKAVEEGDLNYYARSGPDIKDHPLLPHYETLALKTAIQHARDVGADYIAISDAETAMMTEGHDRYAGDRAVTEYAGKYNIPQEPGMRAAYDQRLPAIAEKLTGKKGEVVDFGVHKATMSTDPSTGYLRHGEGSPVFKGKTNVTARLYDLSSTPAEFSAFGYSKPMAGAPGASKDILTNRPPSDRFTADVQANLHDTFSRVLSERFGFSGTLRDFYVNMGVAIAKQLDGVPAEFFRVASPEWGLARGSEEGVAQVGLNLSDAGNVSPGEATKYVNRILDTFAHEIAHINSYIVRGLIDAPDAFSRQRREQLQHLSTLAEVLTPDEREAILITIKDGFMPNAEQTTPKDTEGRVYGTNDPEEFAVEVTALLTRSLLAGERKGFKNGLEVLDFSPPEVREYANGVYRHIHDVLQGMKDTIADPFFREMAGKEALPVTNRVFTSDAMVAVIGAAREGSQLREADYALAQLRGTVATLSPGGAIAPPITSAVWFRATDGIEQNYRGTGLAPETRAMAPVTEAMDQVKEFLGVDKPTPTKTPGLWSRWFAPFAQLMFEMERKGVPLARPLAELSLGLPSAITRTRTEILRPILREGLDGLYHYNEEQALMRKLAESKKGPWRDALISVRRWQQENNTQQMFEVGPEGTINVSSTTPNAKEAWDRIRARLKPEDQQYVMGASLALDQIGQLGGQHLVITLGKSVGHRISRLLMTMNPRMTYDQALGLSEQLMQAYASKDVSSVSRTILPEQMKQLDRLLAGPTGLLAKLGEVAEKLTNRPGFSTESLPGEWIVRFLKPGASAEKGEFSFLSADSKHKANLLARKLKGEGNAVSEVIHRDELRNYAEFDDPDRILAKFAMTENEVWQDFVTKFEADYAGVLGGEAMDALRAFTPGATTLKEIGTKGLNKFLTKREAKVDRDRYDYIDGTFAWVDRLAASMTYRLVGQMKDLILLDPRAKRFPQLAGMVNPHFENLMSPTGKGVRELKAFSTAFMMGGSLASVVINASQSLVSLVPVLIQLDQKTGPVGTYKNLWKATAKAASVTFDDGWQKVARETEGVDPTKWTLEQAQAALYKRSIQDGGINHGVILDDVFTGTDQKQMMVAKFGHGNYGGVTAGELARNVVYLGSQLSLKPFGWVERFNNKISLMAGVEQGYRQGLRGEALYDHAKLVKTLSTYGGGKANVPGVVPKLSTAYTRSAVGVAYTLQQYAFGLVATYAQLVRESLGNHPNLTGQQRRQAVKALGTMLATQTAMAGVLGLPFAAASLSLIEKIFGVPANQLVREGLASLGDDDQEGAVIAETALNGLGNQMFGLDVSSRLGVASLLGTSAYRGFNLADLLGPAQGVVANALDALNWFGQNRPERAMKSLVPVAFKNIVEMSTTKARYGDVGIRDAGENLLHQPTTGEAMGYTVGFRPRELSQKRQAQDMLNKANERATAKRSRELDEAARMLVVGDPSQAMTLAQSARLNDPTIDPRSILRSVVQRGVDSQFEKDLLASGPTSNENERQRIAGTFQGDVVSRQSEVQRQFLADQLGQRLGLPSDPAALQRARWVDMLVQTRGMPRSQAMRLVEFLR